MDDNCVLINSLDIPLQIQIGAKSLRKPHTSKTTCVYVGSLACLRTCGQILIYSTPNTAIYRYFTVQSIERMLLCQLKFQCV